MDNSCADAYDLVQRSNLGGSTIQIIPRIDALVLIYLDAVFPADQVDGILGVTVLDEKRNARDPVAGRRRYRQLCRGDDSALVACNGPERLSPVPGSC